MPRRHLTWLGWGGVLFAALFLPGGIPLLVWLLYARPDKRQRAPGR